MEIKCPGIKRLQLTAIWRWLRHRTAKIFTYRLGSLIKAFGIDEMEPFGRFACAERKLGANLQGPNTLARTIAGDFGFLT